MTSHVLDCVHQGVRPAAVDVSLLRALEQGPEVKRLAGVTEVMVDFDEGPPFVALKLIDERSTFRIARKVVRVEDRADAPQ